MRGNGFRDGGNVFTNNTFHAKTEHKSTVSPRLLQLLACVLPPLHKSIAPSRTPLTHVLLSLPPQTPPPTYLWRRILSVPRVPLCVWFKARTLYYIRFCVLYIMLYISPPFDLPRSPLLFALTAHKLVPRANADSGQFLWRQGIHAHFVTSVRYLDGIPLQLQDLLSAQFSLLQSSSTKHNETSSIAISYNSGL